MDSRALTALSWVVVGLYIATYLASAIFHIEQPKDAGTAFVAIVGAASAQITVGTVLGARPRKPVASPDNDSEDSDK